MRVRIIGGPGSGKTYLGKRLSQKFGIPHIDLDDLYWDDTKNSYEHRMPERKRERLLNKILKKRSWIIEGVYYEGWAKVIDKRSEHTTLIVPPIWKAKYRILKRFLLEELNSSTKRRATLSQFIGLWRWLSKYYREKLPEIRTRLNPKEFRSADLAYEWLLDTY